MNFMYKTGINKRGITFILQIIPFILLVSNVFGQSNQTYSLYMFNIQIDNPAYVGSMDMLDFSVLGRNQIDELVTSPKTYTLSVQSPIQNQGAGLGLNITENKIGLLKSTHINANYAYEFSLKKSLALRIGIRGGYSNYSFNSDDRIIPNDEITYDDYVYGNNSTYVGIGTFLSSPKFYTGLAFPKLVSYEISAGAMASSVGNLSFVGGYVFDVNRILKLKPSFHIRNFSNGNHIIDLNASLLLYNKIWFGTMYRFGETDALGFNINLFVMDRLRIGYAFDYRISKGQNGFKNGAHEFGLSYEIAWKKQRIYSPRYF